MIYSPYLQITMPSGRSRQVWLFIAEKLTHVRLIADVIGHISGPTAGEQGVAADGIGRDGDVQEEVIIGAVKPSDSSVGI